MDTIITVVAIATGQAAANAPLKDETPGAGGAPGSQEGKADHTIFTDTAAERKPWKSVQARCLLAGFNASLIDGDDGKPLLVVSRWAMCKSFSHIADAEAWIQRVAGSSQ